MILSLIAAALAAPACPPLPGVEAVLARPTLNYVLIAEYHGTTEMPAIAGDAACAAAAATGRPIVFGVEFEPADQPALDAFMTSDGGPTARAALLASPGWRERGGRTTVAIADLIETLRRLGRRHPVSVVAFDSAREPTGTSPRREAAMADSLRRARERRPGSLVVVLTGAGHADKEGFTSATPPFLGAAGHLPAAETISLTFARPGGRYWGCSEAVGCGEQAMPVREPIVPRGITLDATIRGGFDGIYAPGRSYTASHPAVAGAE